MGDNSKIMLELEKTLQESNNTEDRNNVRKTNICAATDRKSVCFSLCTAVVNFPKIDQ